MTVKLPYIKWREGRPRLIHGARERALGFSDRDLRHPPLDDKGRPTGPWFSYEEAAAVSAAHHPKILAARTAGKRIKPAKPVASPTIEALMDDWLASPEVKALAPASIASYAKAMRAVIFRPESR